MRKEDRFELWLIIGILIFVFIVGYVPILKEESTFIGYLSGYGAGLAAAVVLSHMLKENKENKKYKRWDDGFKEIQNKYSDEIKSLNRIQITSEGIRIPNGVNLSEQALTDIQNLYDSTIGK
jgi:hypothetical protein